MASSALAVLTFPQLGVALPSSLDQIKAFESILRGVVLDEQYSSVAVMDTSQIGDLRGFDVRLYWCAMLLIASTVRRRGKDDLLQPALTGRSTVSGCVKEGTICLSFYAFAFCLGKSTILERLLDNAFCPVLREKGVGRFTAPLQSETYHLAGKHTDAITM